MRCIACTVAGLAVLVSTGALAAQTQSPPDRSSAPLAQKPPPQGATVAQATKAKAVGPVRALSEQAHKDRINAWTLGLAAGRLEGAPILYASELARVLDDGDNMRVLPIVTRGPFDNVYDLLYLRGVDLAIVYGDVLDHFR